MKQYMEDAFTDRVFSGNPAAVCVLEAWPDEQLMKNIALENNLSLFFSQFLNCRCKDMENAFEKIVLKCPGNGRIA